MMKLALLSLSLLITSTALAADVSPVLSTQDALENSVQNKEKKFIPNAAFIQITPRGMKLFKDSIYGILQQAGSFQLEENMFSPQKLELEPITTEKLLESRPEQLKLVKTARKFVVEWLNGLSLGSPHRFVIEIGNTGYQARFSKFSLVSDETLLKKMNKTDGAVFTLELEAEKISVFSDRVRVQDLANPFFQKVGFDGVTLTTKNNNTIKLRVPFFINLKPDSSLEIKLLDLEHNVADLNLDFKYKKLITGQYQIISKDEDGKNAITATVNTKKVSEFVEINKDMINDELKKAIGNFITNELPKYINEKAKDFSQNKLTSYDYLAAPQPHKVGETSETKPRQAPFIIGHRIMPGSLKQQNGLSFALSSLVDDPTNPNSLPDPRHGATAPVVLNLMPTDQVDAIAVINQGIINRIINLSFQRGNFTNMEMTDCKTNKKSGLTLTEAPIISAYPQKVSNNPLVSYAKVTLGISTPMPAGYESYADGNLRIKFDSVIKIQKGFCKIPVKVYDETTKRYVTKEIPDTQSSCLEILKDETLFNTLKIDTSNLSLLAKIAEKTFSKVTKEVTAELKKMDTPCAGGPTPIVDSIPLPPEIYKIKFDIALFKVDASGQLVLYLNYQNGVTPDFK